MWRRWAGITLAVALVGVGIFGLLYLLPEGQDERDHRDQGVTPGQGAGPHAPRASGRSAARAASKPPVLEPEAHYVPQNDPASPDYDPRAFAMSVESAVDVWKAEPRREPWATRREASIKSWLDEHLKRAVPTAKVLEIECKQQTCKVAVDVDDLHANDLGGRYPLFMLAPFAEASTGEHGELVFTLVYRADLLGEDAFQDYLQRTLEQLRAKGGSR